MTIYFVKYQKKFLSGIFKGLVLDQSVSFPVYHSAQLFKEKLESGNVKEDLTRNKVEISNVVIQEGYNHAIS